MPLGYECETVYLAELSCDSLYFVFTNRRKSLLSVMRADVADDDWTHYNISNLTAAIRHPVTSGAWIIRLPQAGSTALVNIVFSKKSEKGCVFNPHIHKTNMIVPSEDILKGRHYDMLIEDDIASSVSTPEDAIKAIKWYERVGGKYVKKKEVKKKMKSLFHVILFNRETEKIDFKEYIPAEDREAAVMQAAQSFGKYFSKIHLTIAWQIHDSGYDPIKD